jgi:hypothetical protein
MFTSNLKVLKEAVLTERSGRGLGMSVGQTKRMGRGYRR